MANQHNINQVSNNYPDYNNYPQINEEHMRNNFGVNSTSIPPNNPTDVTYYFGFAGPTLTKNNN